MGRHVEGAVVVPQAGQGVIEAGECVLTRFDGVSEILVWLCVKIC